MEGTSQGANTLVEVPAKHHGAVGTGVTQGDMNAAREGSVAELLSCSLAAKTQVVPTELEAAFNEDSATAVSGTADNISGADVAAANQLEVRRNTERGPARSHEVMSECRQVPVGDEARTSVAMSQECQGELSAGAAAAREGHEDCDGGAEAAGPGAKRASLEQPSFEEELEPDCAVSESEYKAISKGVIDCVWGFTFMEGTSPVERQLLPPELLEPLERRRPFITSAKARLLRALRASMLIEGKPPTSVQIECDVDLPQVTLPMLRKKSRGEHVDSGSQCESAASMSCKSEYHGSDRGRVNSDDGSDSEGARVENGSARPGKVDEVEQLSPVLVACDAKLPTAATDGTAPSALLPRPPSAGSFACRGRVESLGDSEHNANGGSLVLPLSGFTMAPLNTGKLRESLLGHSKPGSGDCRRLSVQAARRVSRRISDVPPPAARFPTPPRGNQRGDSAGSREASDAFYASAAAKLRSANGVWEEVYDIIEETRDTVLCATEGMEAVTPELISAPDVPVQSVGGPAARGSKMSS